jgi:hypothetical protein
MEGGKRCEDRITGKNHFLPASAKIEEKLRALLTTTRKVGNSRWKGMADRRQKSGGDFPLSWWIFPQVMRRISRFDG